MNTCVQMIAIIWFKVQKSNLLTQMQFWPFLKETEKLALFLIYLTSPINRKQGRQMVNWVQKRLRDNISNLVYDLEVI